MKAKTSGLASQALAQQVEIFGGSLVSLNSLWRVSGSPTGHDPRSWIRLAGPLLEGYDTYRSKVKPAGSDQETGEVVWTWEGDSKDPWQEGDLMTECLVALAYAIYLDEEVRLDHDRRLSLD